MVAVEMMAIMILEPIRNAIHLAITISIVIIFWRRWTIAVASLASIFREGLGSPRRRSRRFGVKVRYHQGRRSNRRPSTGRRRPRRRDRSDEVRRSAQLADLSLDRILEDDLLGIDEILPLLELHLGGSSGKYTLDPAAECLAAVSLADGGGVAA